MADDTEEGAKDAKEVETALAAAQPGEFACVPIRFANMAGATNVYIQPHRWGLGASCNARSAKTNSSAEDTTNSSQPFASECPSVGRHSPK